MIEGIAPMNTTKYTVASVIPNQRIAAGTQATDGRTCSPEISGPKARRSGATWASTRPTGVAITTLIRKPTTPRCSEVQTAS
ncbi:hypothetical protein SRABI128_05422 [Microbacterium sp. Bi128]|nr:hypothetical protein SRABI128_05422 [Microbacterium sp. Bi128]